MPLSGNKPWWKSKTIISMIVAVLVVAWNEAIAVGFGLPVIPEFVYALLAALGIYGRTSATTKVGS